DEAELLLLDRQAKRRRRETSRRVGLLLQDVAIGELEPRADGGRVELDRAPEQAFGFARVTAEEAGKLQVEPALGGERIGVVRVELDRAIELAPERRQLERILQPTVDL